MKIRVLLADDHTMVRDGLRALLETEGDMIVVDGVSNGLEAVSRSRQLKPDVVVMDIAMPGLNGIDAAGQIRQSSAESRVIILSIHSTTEHVYRALRAGVHGYLLKESAGSELVEAIRAVHGGRKYLSQQITELILDGYLLQHEKSPLDELSQREREVLQLVAEGLSSQQISNKLSLSIRTVETYRSRIMHKLNLHDLSSLIRFAIENGLAVVGKQP